MGRCASVLLIIYFSQGVAGHVQKRTLCLYPHAPTRQYDKGYAKSRLTYSYSIIFKIPYRKKERINRIGTLCIVYFFL